MYNLLGTFPILMWMFYYISNDSYTAILNKTDMGNSQGLSMTFIVITRTHLSGHSPIMLSRSQDKGNNMHLEYLLGACGLRQTMDGDGQLLFTRLFFRKTLILMLVDLIGKFKLENSCVEPSTHLNSQGTPPKRLIFTSTDSCWPRQINMWFPPVTCHGYLIVRSQ